MKLLDKIKWTILFVLIISMFGGLIYTFNYNYEETTITVVEKERVVRGETSNYLIWSEEGEVYKVDDAFFRFQFDASDRYGELSINRTYKITVVGHRFRLFSVYKNIISIEEL